MLPFHFKMPGNVRIEVCVDSVASAQAAERGGAHRLELCSDLLEGGITPSAGLIEVVREQASIPLHIMIRPRAGDFCYDEQELEVMRRDIQLAKTLRAQGIVLGILDPAGKVDVPRTRQLVELARPLSVTFHRAFDMSSDLLRALDDVCSTGAERLLSSGGEQTSLQGADTIASLVHATRGRISIMAGSGINPTNAAALIRRTGVREIHVGLSTQLDSPMLFRKEDISMGKIPGREYLRSQVLEENVRALTRALQQQDSTDTTIPS